MLLQGLARGWTDGGNFQFDQLAYPQPQLAASLCQGFYAIHAGEDEPVIGFVFSQSAIEL
jgi:hypothetical protein